MKVLKKDFLIKTNNIDYTKAEKDILTKGFSFLYIYIKIKNII